MKQILISSSRFTITLNQCFLGARLYSTLTQTISPWQASQTSGQLGLSVSVVEVERIECAFALPEAMCLPRLCGFCSIAQECWY